MASPSKDFSKSNRSTNFQAHEKPEKCPECGYACEVRHLAVGLDYNWCLICEQEVDSDFFNPYGFGWPGLDDDFDDDGYQNSFSSLPFSA